MTRFLAIICVFLIVIGLYSYWRYPRTERAESDPVSVVTPEIQPDEPQVTGPEDIAADAVEPVTPDERKERSLDR